MIKRYKNTKLKRKARIKNKLIRVASGRPRLTVFRSNKFIYVQLVNDQTRSTIAAASDKKLTAKESKELTKTQRAALVGSEIAQLALKAKIKQVYFDRGYYKFHGRIKALAEAAREKGLEF